MDQFYMVYRDNSGSTKVKHGSYNEAENEAKRLASNQPGDRFYILAAVSAFEVELVKKTIMPVFTALRVGDAVLSALSQEDKAND